MSALALLKMAMHARSGGDLEVSGSNGNVLEMFLAHSLSFHFITIFSPLISRDRKCWLASVKLTQVKYETHVCM